MNRLATLFTQSYQEIRHVQTITACDLITLTQMKEEFNLVHDCDVKEEIDYISLGKAMKKIRTSAGITQEKAAAIFQVPA